MPSGRQPQGDISREAVSRDDYIPLLIACHVTSDVTRFIHVLFNTNLPQIQITTPLWKLHDTYKTSPIDLQSSCKQPKRIFFQQVHMSHCPQILPSHDSHEPRVDQECQVNQSAVLLLHRLTIGMRITLNPGKSDGGSSNRMMD